jgi:RES domain-containing protein
MISYRIAREKYKNSLSGIGAAKFGGRWNSAGIEIIYTASNRALAMAELLVHIDMSEVPEDYFMISIHIPDHLQMQHIDAKDLPLSWNKLIEYQPITRSIGNKFVQENEYAILSVPSAVVRGDHNILINPYHTAFVDISIKEVEPFPFDHRLFE